MIRMSLRLVLLCSLLMSAMVKADWQLDAAASSVHFVSIKNDVVAESHRFKQLRGSISDAGAASLSIALASVDTGIEIRDQRMREMLFQVVDFPRANISLQLDGQWLTELSVNTPQSLSAPLQLEVHDQSSQLQANLLVFLDAAGCLHVLSEQPLLVNASDFGFTDGINALREVAGLGSIANVVPVSVHLRYRPVN